MYANFIKEDLEERLYERLDLDIPKVKLDLETGLLLKADRNQFTCFVPLTQDNLTLNLNYFINFSSPKRAFLGLRGDFFLEFLT